MNGIKWHFYTDISPKLLAGGFSFSFKCHLYTDVSLKLNDRLSFSFNFYFYADVSLKLPDGEVSFSFYLIDKACEVAYRQQVSKMTIIP